MNESHTISSIIGKWNSALGIRSLILLLRIKKGFTGQMAFAFPLKA